MKIGSQGRHRLLLVFGALAVATTFLVSGAARAQAPVVDQAAVDKLIAMNKRALDDFDTLEFDSAKRTLLEALVAGKKAGLENHPIMARTYVHLGAVYITGLKDRQKGVQSFVRAIEIDPTIRISKAMSAPELEEAFADALKQVKPRASAPVAAAPPPPPPPPPVEAPPPKKRAPIMEDESAAEPPAKKKRAPVMEDEAAAAPKVKVSGDEDSGEPDLPVHINALDCPTPDEVPPDKSVKLRCAAAANLNLAKVLLMYRLPGSEEFGTVEMERTPKGWFQGKIPKKAVTGKSVQFYFEGRNAGGKAVVSNGRSDSPNLILIRDKAEAEEVEAEAAEASGGRAVDTEENPLDERDEAAGPRLYLGKVDKSKIGLDTRYGNRKWWIGLGLGSGFGYAKGDGFEVRTDLRDRYIAGGGWAGLGHLAPELGFQLTPDFAISIQGRNQWIPQSKKYSQYAATGAHSVLLRLLFFTKQSRLRFYGSMMGGAGEGFRFIVYPTPNDPNHSGFKDTVRGGPYLAGAGGGLYYEISKGLSFTWEINALAGFPIFSVVADMNLALQVNFY